jgi:hypothetical protein
MPPIALRATEHAFTSRPKLLLLFERPDFFCCVVELMSRIVGGTYSILTRPMFWGAAPSARTRPTARPRGKAINSVRSLGKAGLPSKMGFG